MQLLWFNKIKQAAMQYWAARQKREQQSLMIGGVVVGLLLIYALIISPIFQHLSDLRDTISHDEKTLAWMRGMDAAIAQYADQPIQAQKQLTTVDALATLQKAIQTSPLANGLTGLKQNSNNSVEVQLQHVSFDALMRFLGKLLKANALMITNFSSTASETPGVVNADFILSVGSR
jgi:type II secretory pathway component PulM